MASVDLRERVVNAYLEGMHTADEVAQIFQIGVRSLYRYVRQYEETGDLSPKPPPGPNLILDERAHQLIRNLVLQQPDIRLVDLCDTVEMQHGKRISEPVM